MRALVIGGTGPTGPFLVEGLQNRGYDVSILHRGEHEVSLPGSVQHIHTDPHFLEPIRDSLADNRFDIVVATYGRLRLLVEALNGVTDRLITIGAAIYVNDGSRPADERTERDNRNKLFRRIIETEQNLFEAHDQGRYSVSHFRYPNLYGPRQLAPREWSIIRRIRDGRAFIPVLDGGLTLESRAYAENAAYAVLLAVDHEDEAAGQIYNVSDSYTPSDADRVAAIAGAMGAEVELLNLPRDVGVPAFYWGIGRDLGFAAQGRAPSTNHKILDISKIETELGYSDLVGFEEAVRRTVDFYLANPPQIGGELEQQLSDPFDYEAEDRFLEARREFSAACESIPIAQIEFRHQYAHPREPNAGE